MSTPVKPVPAASPVKVADEDLEFEAVIERAQRRDFDSLQNDFQDERRQQDEPRENALESAGEDGRLPEAPREKG
jgi:hypothetical protein